MDNSRKQTYGWLGVLVVGLGGRWGMDMAFLFFGGLIKMTQNCGDGYIIL